MFDPGIGRIRLGVQEMPEEAMITLVSKPGRGYLRDSPSIEVARFQFGSTCPIDAQGDIAGPTVWWLDVVSRQWHFGNLTWTQAENMMRVYLVTCEMA